MINGIKPEPSIEDFDWCSEKHHLAGSYDELSMEMS